MNLNISSAPHIRSSDNTRKLMLTVLVALVPALIAGVIVFGIRALIVVAISMAASVATELVCGLVTGKKASVTDGSAAVTGLLLALTLPASVPYWMPAVGGVFAIVVAKCLCGGLGQNVFNPALAARAFLMLFWPTALVRYAAPGALGLANNVDIVSSSTPLQDMSRGVLPGDESLLDMFLGNTGGTIGEVSALALLIGAAILLATRTINWRIPVSYVGTVAALSLFFARGDDPIMWMLCSVFGGGLLIGAIFMATDYSSSPTSPLAQLVFGIGCGALTILFRYKSLYPEGITYAILTMNAFAWALDRYLPPRRFGVAKGGPAQ